MRGAVMRLPDRASAERFVDDGAGDVDVGRGHESLELAAGIDLDDLQPIAGLDQIDAGQAGSDGGAGAQGEVLDVRRDRAGYGLGAAGGVRHPVLRGAV